MRLLDDGEWLAICGAVLEMERSIAAHPSQDEATWRRRGLLKSAMEKIEETLR